MMNPMIEIILKKMFDKVGATYQPKNVITEGWFQKYWWTSMEEQEFRQWFLKQLIGFKELRKAIMSHPILRSKKHLNKVIDYFLLNYGWTTLYKNKFDSCDINEPEGYYLKEIKKVLSKNDYKEFNKFLKGQTVSVYKNNDIVNIDDFERFKNMLNNRKR